MKSVFKISIIFMVFLGTLPLSVYGMEESSEKKTFSSLRLRDPQDRDKEGDEVSSLNLIPELSKSLESLGSLDPHREELELCERFLADQNGISLLKSISFLDKLSKLNLCRNKLGDSFAKEIVLMLDKLLPSLIFLDLNDNEIGIEGFKAIGASLGINQSLTTLKLGGNLGYNEGLQFIIEGLQGNSVLTDLDIHNNKATNKIASYIRKLLQQNITLRFLDLSENSFGSEGGIDIALGLKKNSSLISLNLNKANIQTEGANAFSKTLNKNKHLRSLYLNSNGISSEGIMRIIRALAWNTSLQTLSLKDNLLNEEEENEVLSILAKNTTLTQLNLPDSMKNKEDQLTFLSQRNKEMAHIKNVEKKGLEQGKKNASSSKEPLATASEDSFALSKAENLIPSHGFGLESLDEIEEFLKNGSLIIIPNNVKLLLNHSEKHASNYKNHQGGIILDLREDCWQNSSSHNLLELATKFNNLTSCKIIIASVRCEIPIGTLESFINIIIRNNKFTAEKKNKKDIIFDLSECRFPAVRNYISKQKVRYFPENSFKHY